MHGIDLQDTGWARGRDEGGGAIGRFDSQCVEFDLVAHTKSDRWHQDGKGADKGVDNVLQGHRHELTLRTVGLSEVGVAEIQVEYGVLV